MAKESVRQDSELTNSEVIRRGKITAHVRRLSDEKAKSAIGQKWGHLEVVGDAGLVERCGQLVRLSIVRCVCGKELKVRFCEARAKKSCGCRGIPSGKQRHTGNPLYRRWRGIIARCQGKHSSDRYYDRGIRVCQRWAESFEAFVDDMSPMPGDANTVDRKNNDGGYWCGKAECPECGPLGREPNCRWATVVQQCNNRRSNKMVEYLGSIMTLADACRAANVKYGATQQRMLKGMTFDQAVEAFRKSS